MLPTSSVPPPCPPAPGLSVVIPTYRRETVLINTIQMLLRQTCRAAEILVVDQSPEHEPAVREQLEAWHQQGSIKWVPLQPPSIAMAMNRGLELASQDLVLFLDDDIEAADDLLQEHLRAHQEFPDASAVVGQVLQPGGVARPLVMQKCRHGLSADLLFPFSSSCPDWVSNVMAGNLSVDRAAALAAGGFDENFHGVSFRIETEFARRLLQAGGKIRFHPAAGINHLRWHTGGTRSAGRDPAGYATLQADGDYYFAFRCGRGAGRWRYICQRLYRELFIAYYFRRPWRMPLKLLAEFTALLRSSRLARDKARTLSQATGRIAAPRR